MKIGLLTPYTGGNLGDGAIQEAVIQNIKKRIPNASIIGITLYPEDTEIRHKIPSFPLCGYYNEHYATFSSKKDNGYIRSPDEKTNLWQMVSICVLPLTGSEPRFQPVGLKNGGKGRFMKPFPRRFHQSAPVSR